MGYSLANVNTFLFSLELCAVLFMMFTDSVCMLLMILCIEGGVRTMCILKYEKEMNPYYLFQVYEQHTKERKSLLVIF